MNEIKAQPLPIMKRSLQENAWLNLGDVSKLQIDNPLGRDDFDIEHPGLAEMRLMRNPEYLSYAAEVLLDIENLPVTVPPSPDRI